jgi:hypothetical protein
MEADAQEWKSNIISAGYERIGSKYQFLPMRPSKKYDPLSMGSRGELARACGKRVQETNDDTLSIEDAEEGHTFRFSQECLHN